jgi:hypothetical protein
MWISSHVDIQGNERADILAKEGSTSGTFFQYQAGLTTVNTSDRMAGKMEWQRDEPLLLFDSTEGFSLGMDGFQGGRKGLFGGDV